MQILSARNATYTAECEFPVLPVCGKTLNERIYIVINESGGVEAYPI